MARTINILTDKFIRSITEPDRYLDGACLYLQVTVSKRALDVLNMSWVYAYQFDGVYTELGLGPYRLRSLAEARDIRDAYNKLRLDGVDPREHRDRQAKA